MLEPSKIIYDRLVINLKNMEYEKACTNNNNKEIFFHMDYRNNNMFGIIMIIETIDHTTLEELFTNISLDGLRNYGNFKLFRLIDVFSLRAGWNPSHYLEIERKYENLVCCSNPYRIKAVHCSKDDNHHLLGISQVWDI